MISVIVPVLNEERVLQVTLTSLFGQSGDFEVILVDGGSRDASLDIAGQFSKIRILHAPRGRAIQMNTGAAQATGDWLLFLHADTELPEGAMHEIRALSQGVQAGGFRQQFRGRHPALKVISWLDNFRCKRTGVIYGDQALFVRRGLFEDLGGFPLSVMEDLYFGERLLTRTRPTLLNHAVITDSRKFEQQGIWRSFFRVLTLMACAHKGWNLPGFCHRFFEDVR